MSEATQLVLVSVGLVRWGHRVEAGREVPTWIVAARPEGVHLAGVWELPGGKVGPAEPPERALERELHEELGVRVEPPEPLTFSHHAYPERRVLLLFHRTALAPDSPPPQPRAASELRACTTRELLELPMPPANEPLKAALSRELDAGSER